MRSTAKNTRTRSNASPTTWDPNNANYLDPNSEDGFAKLVRDNRDCLARYCHKYARDPDDQQDLVQSTWELAWERRGDYRGSGPFVGWLLRLARTVCLRAIRVRRDDADVERARDFHMRLRSPTADAALEQQEAEDYQLSLIMALPSRRRAVVLARLVEGMSTEETAAFLRCSPGTVKATLHCARVALRAAAAAWEIRKSKLSDGSRVGGDTT